MAKCRSEFGKIPKWKMKFINNSKSFPKIKTMTNSCKESISSIQTTSTEDESTTFFGQLKTYTNELLYHLTGKISYFNTIAIVCFIVDSLAFIALSIDPSYSWGPSTKSVLQVIGWIRGPVIKSSWRFSAGVSINGIAFLTPLILIILYYYLLSTHHYQPGLYKTVLVITHLMCRCAYIPIMNALLIPMRCNLLTGEMVDFQGYQCFRTPNVILFVMSFLPMSIMIMWSFLNYRL